MIDNRKIKDRLTLSAQTEDMRKNKPSREGVVISPGIAQHFEQSEKHPWVEIRQTLERFGAKSNRKCN